MSKVRIYGDVSGYVDIAVPDNAGTTTLNLDKIPQADINGNIAMDTNTLYVDAANNRVGVGTASPNTTLDIVSPSNAEAIHIRGRSADDIGQLKFYENDGTTGLARLDSRTTHFEVGSYNELRFSAGGVGNSHAVIDTSGNVGIGTATPLSGFHISDGTNAGSPQNASRKATLMIDAGATASADLQFMVRNGYNSHIFFGDATDPNVGMLWYDHSTNHMNFMANTNHAMTIDDNGHVGIGSTNPGQRLTIEGAADDVNSEVRITATSVASGYLGADSNGFNIGTDTAGLYFKTGVTGGQSVGATGTARMVINSSGQVGIGTTNPGVKLDVAGEIASRASSPGLYLYDSNVTNLYHRIIGGGNAGLEFSADLNNVGAGYHRWDIGPNTRMYLTEAGNLGIGTTSPAEKLEIKDYKDGTGNNINGVGLLISSTSSSAGSNSANGGTGIEFAGYGHNYNGAGTGIAGSNPIAIKINPVYEYWGQNNAMSNYGQTYPYLKFDFLKSDNSNYITPLLVSGLGNGRVAIGNDTSNVSHRLSIGSDSKPINYRVSGSGGHAISDGTYEENARSFSLGGSEEAFITEGTVSNSNKWRVRFEGDFGNNYEGGGLNFPAAQIYVTNTQPTLYIGSTNLTVSRDSSTGKLKVTNQSGSYAVHFTGKITVWDLPQSNRPTFDSEMQAISLQGTDDYGTDLYGGLVMKTPAYSEYHFQWSGQQSHSLTFTCGSYQMSTMEYTSHQTNGGSDIHKYVFGKWANNHTTHTWNEMENNGSTWGLTTTFTATDQSGGSANADGKLVLLEAYGSGSVSTRTLVVKTYYGGWNLTFA